LFATNTPATKKPRTASPNFYGIVMTLIRLEQQKTDIVITINVPHIKGSYDETEIDVEDGKQGKLLDAAVAYQDRFLPTLQIKDWTLFVSE